jgi:hypothetical protein
MPLLAPEIIARVLVQILDHFERLAKRAIELQKFLHLDLTVTDCAERRARLGSVGAYE